MDKIPAFLDKRIFGRIFAIGEIGKLKEEDLMSYEASLKQRRDAESVFNSALRSGYAKGEADGMAKGKHEQAIESAKKMLNKGYKKEEICELLGLQIEEVEKL